MNPYQQNGNQYNNNNNTNNNNNNTYNNNNNNTNTFSFLEQQYNKKPYEQQQFLDRTFNFNDAYITAYKTLPHELKLKFYLSIQEKKMLGKISDHEGYQNILKQIARRVMLMKNNSGNQRNDYQQNDNQQNGKLLIANDDSVKWGTKMDSLCDQHLKKMQNDQMLGLDGGHGGLLSPSSPGIIKSENNINNTYNTQNSNNDYDFLSGQTYTNPIHLQNNQYNPQNIRSSYNIQSVQSIQSIDFSNLTTTNTVNTVNNVNNVNNITKQQQQQQQFQWAQQQNNSNQHHKDSTHIYNTNQNNTNQNNTNYNNDNINNDNNENTNNQNYQNIGNNSNQHWQRQQSPKQQNNNVIKYKQQQQQQQQQQWEWNQEEEEEEEKEKDKQQKQQFKNDTHKIIPTLNNNHIQNTTSNNNTNNNISNNTYNKHQNYIDIWDLQDNQDLIQQQKKNIQQVFKKKQTPKKQQHIQQQQQHKQQKQQQYNSIQVQKPIFSRKAVSQYQYNNNHNNHIINNNYNHNILSDNDIKQQVQSNKQWINGYQNNKHATVGGFDNNRPPSRTNSGPSQGYSDDYYDGIGSYQYNNDNNNNQYNNNNDNNDNNNQYTFTKNTIQNNQLYNYSDTIDNNNNNTNNAGYINMNDTGKLQLQEGQQFEWQSQKQQGNNKVQIRKGQQMGDYQNYLMGSSNNNYNYNNNQEYIRTQSNYDSTTFGAEDLASFQFQFNNNNNNNNNNNSNHHHYQINNQPKQQQQQQQQQQNDLKQSNSSQFFPSTHIQSAFLQQFKQYYNTTKLQQILDHKKHYDIQREFYHQSLQLITFLGYSNTNNTKNIDYQYVKQQKQICQQIYYYTQQHTSAVDQNQQHIVKQAINKSKQLYKKLDIKKTTKIVKKYLRLNGISTKYQIVKLSLDAGIPKQLITKYKDNTQLLDILTTQYTIQNLSSITNFSTLSTHIVDYLEYQLSQMEKAANNLACFPVSIQKNVKNSSKFKKYKIDLIKIVSLAKRLLDIGKICLKDQSDSHILAIYQNIKQILTQDDSNNTLNMSYIDNKYVQFYSQFACNPQTTIYSLFSEYRKFIAQHPICCICLKQVSSSQDGSMKSKQQQKYYHYSCFNLQKAIYSFKLKSLNMPQQKQIEEEVQNKQQQQQEQNKQQQLFLE